MIELCLLRILQMYKKIFSFLNKFFRPDQVFKFGFNFSPMYRRSVGKLTHVSRNLHTVKIEIPLNYKNANYVGSIFGGSLFAATDPIYMIQLVQILGNDYIVWDKAATINYKKPARSKALATFEFSIDEIESIKLEVAKSQKMDFIKHLNIVSEKGEVFAELEKTMYICTKEYYRLKNIAQKNQ